MRYNLWLFAALWCAVYSALRLFPQLALARTLVTLGSLLLTGVVADLLVKLVVNLLPRKLVPDLRDRAVLVTGCSSGFGLSLAKRLDALGVTVYAGLRNPQCPGAVELRETCSDNLHILVLDVTKEQDVQDAVTYVHKTIGDKVFWAVVSNAGTAMASPVEWMPEDDFQLMWNTNTMGSVRMSRAFLPLLRKSRGRLAFVNSMGGLTSAPLAVAYSMSKFALAAFAEGLRRELWKSGVSVHTIHPYFYKTNLLDLQRHRQYIDKNWNNLSAEVRDSYGEEYLKRFKRWLELIVGELAYKNFDSAVEDIIDAAVGATPKFSYVPDWGPKFLVWNLNNLPHFIIDFLIGLQLQQARRTKS